MRGEYTLDGMPTYASHTHTHYWQIFQRWRETGGNPKTTHTNIGRKITEISHRPSSELSIEPGTLKVQESNVPTAPACHLAQYHEHLKLLSFYEIES